MPGISAQFLNVHTGRTIQLHCIAVECHIWGVFTTIISVCTVRHDIMGKRDGGISEDSIVGTGTIPTKQIKITVEMGGILCFD